MNAWLSPAAQDDFLLDLGSDLHLRSRWFVPESFAHPAKLHLGLLGWIIDKYTLPGQTIADPMCGSGSILFAATMQRTVIAREIEPKWVEIAFANASHIMRESGLFVGQMSVGQHNAREPWGYKADHVIFSPPYGNEANTTANRNRALQYRLRDGKIDLDSRWQSLLDQPTDGSAGMVAFHYGNHPAQMGHFRGKRYWRAMTDIYSNAYKALGHGYLIIIVKDHIADGQRVRTADRTIDLCKQIGFAFVARHQRLLPQLSFWQRRRKEKGLPVVEEEDVLVFQRPIEGEVG